MQTSPQLQDFLNALVQLIIVLVPVAITWFIRTYVKGAQNERDIAAIVQLSNSAIDFVENLDSQGKLGASPDVSKGLQKLQVGSKWLVDELQRNNIKMSEEDAQKWLQSEFQKRVGDPRPVKQIAQVTQIAIETVIQLQRTGVLQLPPGADQITYLADLAADWILVNLPSGWSNITRDEAMSFARAELLKRAPQLPPVTPGGTSAPADPLAPLAAKAVDFVEQLKADGKVALKPGAATDNLDSDLALAWLLTEAAKQGVSTTPEQLAKAVKIELDRRNALTT